jgi:anaerobic sulfite reductase subunit B
MLNLIPEIALLTERYDDGENALHLQFQLQGDSRWQAQPGQFFMLSLPGIGEAAFTFVSLPDQHGCFSALVRKVGHLTKALDDLPLGSVVGVRGPLGQPWPTLNAKTVLIVAGGCGLAPLSGWIDQRINNQQQMNTALLYSTRSAASRVLSRERDFWQKNNLPLLQAIDTPALDFAQTCALDIDAALALLPFMPDAVLTCGPEAMMLLTGKLLEQRGITSDNIWVSLERRMHCGIGLCGHCYVGSSLVCKEGPTLTLARTRALLAQQVVTQPAWTHC